MVDQKQTLLTEMLKESIQRGSTPSLKVISDSMTPLLRAGDHIGLRELPSSQTQPGQIITFFSQDENHELITHRVFGSLSEDGIEKIVTFGDRTLLFDAPVDHDAVLGLVVWRKRNGRVLDLMAGRGAMLNSKLARQASNKLNQTPVLEFGSLDIDQNLLNQSNETVRRHRMKFFTRQRFRISYLWALLFTLIFDFLPHSDEGLI